MRTKGRAYQAVVRSILLYGCEAWPARVVDKRMLAVFDNKSIRRILHVRHRDYVPSVVLRRRLRLTSIPARVVQRRLHWFGPTSANIASHVALANRRAITRKAALEPLFRPRVFGYARWRKDWVEKDW